MDIRPVAADQWDVVRWFWQAYRNDLAPVVRGFPRADGRYNTRVLDDYPAAGRVGYLAWRPHPDTGVDSPVGFALVDGLDGARRWIGGFWTVPPARRDGIGLALALDVIARHEGPWAITFQHDNHAAGHFWRRVATRAFGVEGEAWTEEQRPVPGRPHVPHDHWIESRV